VIRSAQRDWTATGREEQEVVSIRICYLERGERGALLRGVRVVGASSDERWDAPSPDLGGADGVARDAAVWIRDHLSASSKDKALHRLVLDADGGVCGWVATEHGDRRLLDALVRERSGEEGGGPAAGDLDAGAGPPRFPDLPGETAIEPLLAPSRTTRSAASLRLPRLGGGRGGDPPDGAANGHGVNRTAVLTQPDVPGRALMDQLDALGVDIVAPISIWHAAAAAWDPSARAPDQASAPHTGENGEFAADVASDQVPVAATVLTDGSGRLLWCWSISGALLAAGSIRLARRDHAETGPTRTRITEAALHRLSSEWLAWSIQLGMMPQRVRLIADFSHEGTLDPSTGTRLIAAVCPDAIGETIDEPDAVGLTLRRLAERIDNGATPADPGSADGRHRLPTLSGRPTRAHRRMHRAAAALLLAAAVALAAWSWRLDTSAERLRERASSASGELIQLIEASGVAPIVNMTAEQLAGDRAIVGILNEARNLIEREVRPPENIEPFRPVMSELDAISFIIQSQPDLTLENVSITQSTASLRILVPDATAFEDITRTLESLGDSRIRWTRPSPVEVPGRGVRVTLTGTWADAANEDL